MSIISETAFLVKILFVKENLIFACFGKVSANKNLPAVLLYFSFILLPLLSTVVNWEMIFE